MTDAIDRFAALVGRPPEEVDLAAAALAYAAVVAPDVDADSWLQVLDHLAWRVTDFDELRVKLFDSEGFSGAADDYYAPENSLLHRVLERRVGIPITLSVVMIEVGRRAGVAVEGIGAPGHFLVRDPVTGRHCDPFHRGAIVDVEDVTSAPVVDAHQILVRMLANLAYAYRAQRRTRDLERVLRCQAVLPGAVVPATLQLGQALAAQGRFTEAAGELRALAVTEAVRAAERERLERTARGILAHLN